MGKFAWSLRGELERTLGQLPSLPCGDAQRAVAAVAVVVVVVDVLVVEVELVSVIVF